MQAYTFSKKEALVENIAEGTNFHVQDFVSFRKNLLPLLLQTYDISSGISNRKIFPMSSALAGQKRQMTE